MEQGKNQAWEDYYNLNKRHDDGQLDNLQQQFPFYKLDIVVNMEI